jgi:pimeloyl-ACP methyl ester carboxylesterase
MPSFFIALFVFLFSPQTFANDLHLRSAKHPSTPSRPAAMTTGTFQQNIDHFGKLPGQTFAQRYWIESSYASGANAPVIFHICGESDVDGAYFLTDNVIAWAQALGAHIVFLEHRYYGQSLPFSDLSTDHMQYLTLDNILEDFAQFQKSIRATQGWTGKWISVGGSYSGTLSALYRQRHPELVVGALASSAPMTSGVGDAISDPSAIDEMSSTDPSVDGDERPWAYQACTSLGYWEAAAENFGATLYYPDSDMCQQLFASAPELNSAAYNQSYDAPFLASSGPSNILFTYGSDDVWTEIGLSEQTNANSGITIQVIQGAGHHFDLNAPSSSDSAAVIAARQEFVTMAKQWLGESPVVGIID